MILVRVTRKKESFDFNFKDPKKWRYTNRLKNNVIDDIEIVLGGLTVWNGKVQSVANHPDAPGDGSWSLANGLFTCTAFIEQRAFNCPVHGIGGGYNIAGQWIDEEHYDIASSDLRHLFHDTQQRGPGNAGKLDSGAYSTGCIIMTPETYADFNRKMESLGLKSGDVFLLKMQGARCV